MHIIVTNSDTCLFGERLLVIHQFPQTIPETLASTVVPGLPPLAFRQYMGSRHGICFQ